MLKMKAKYALTRLGQHTPPDMIRLLDSMANYLAVGHWFQRHGLEVTTRVRDRYKVFDLIVPELKDAHVLYLEFGVWKGASMRYWSQSLRNQRSMLHGFDSFEGLPEAWNETTPKGYFSTEGRCPLVEDERVRFYKGWFEDTLLRYDVPQHDRLFINIDADLYSSAKAVLNRLESHMAHGTFLYFDEFSDRHHEMKAFDEFLLDTGMKFTVRGADRQLSSVLFQRVA